MKTDYKVLLLTFIINLIMALSLNSFSSSTLYLPMIFLYFLSGLASFIDKISFYKSAKLKAEEKISWVCFSACFLVVFFYILNSLDFVEITFYCNDGIYRVLMQGIQNSFFTFNSINITPCIFFLAFMMPTAYLALCIISYLRDQGFTQKIIIDIVCKHKKIFIIIFTSSIVFGIIGIIICHIKYIQISQDYGQPQYYKYFILFFSTYLIVSNIFLFLHYKNKKH